MCIRDRANSESATKKIVFSKTVQYMSPVTTFLDNISDSTLTLTDRMIPSLKTLSYEKIGDTLLLPVKKTKERVKKFKSKNKTLDDNPINSEGQVKTKKEVKDSKPGIRNKLDPLLLPINNRIENVSIKYFSTGNEMPVVTFKSEINRSLKLSSSVFSKMLMSAALLPCKSIIHMNDVFNKELDQMKDLCLKHSIVAKWNTIKTLKEEMIQTIWKKKKEEETRPEESKNSVNDVTLPKFDDKVKVNSLIFNGNESYSQVVSKYKANPKKTQNFSNLNPQSNNATDNGNSKDPIATLEGRSN